MAISRIAPRFGLGVAIIVLALLVPATAISGGFDAKKGVYAPHGHYHWLRFQVSRDDKVVKPTFTMKLSPSPSCKTKFSPRGGPAKIHQDGKFKMTGSSAWIKGRFITRRYVRGHVYGEAAECGSVKLKYWAYWKRFR